jgi:hypothetical protein
MKQARQSMMIVSLTLATESCSQVSDCGFCITGLQTILQYLRRKRSSQDSNLELSDLLDILYRYHDLVTCINHEASKTIDDDCIFDPCHRELLTSVRLWLLYYRFADYFTVS